mmetsp:Transcript_8583/g.12843  ORF Transcript_8583/g.12843 Transcript_8583/m.12843 type:complete len:93 (-) Transcript_8583:153-431(-)
MILVFTCVDVRQESINHAHLQHDPMSYTVMNQESSLLHVYSLRVVAGSVDDGAIDFHARMLSMKPSISKKLPYIHTRGRLLLLTPSTTILPN